MAPEGCFSKNISDEEYDQLVQSKYAGLNLKQKALDKTGVDESQVNEIPPCEFRNWRLGDNKKRIKCGKDGRYRSSAYQVTWLLFSDNQVYVYKHTFNMDEDGKEERTEEYFYKDITNFSVFSGSEEKESWESKGCMKQVPGVTRKMVNRDIFSLIVPGVKFSCEMVNSSEVEEKIMAMKNKLREKKGDCIS